MPLNIPLDSQSPLSLQEQIRARLIELILAGDLAPGVQLPSYREMAEELGISVKPLQMAVRDLAVAGLVQARRGSGVRIADLPWPRTHDSARQGTSPERAWRISVVARTGLHPEVQHWEHRILTALERELAAAGARLRFLAQGSLGSEVRTPLPALVRRAVDEGTDAVVLVEVAADDREEEAVADVLHRVECPCARINSESHRSPLNAISYDNDWGGYLAGRLLCERGHLDLLMPLPGEQHEVGHEGANLEWVEERRSGVARACRHYGARLYPFRLSDADLSEAGAGTRRIDWQEFGRAAARRLMTDYSLSVGGTPVGIVALNDAAALAILEVLGEPGHHAPDDFSIVGFDNTEVGRAFGLATIEPPIEELGREAARLILDALRLPAADRRQAPVQHLLVKPRPIPRASVAARVPTALAA